MAGRSCWQRGRGCISLCGGGAGPCPGRARAVRVAAVPSAQPGCPGWSSLIGPARAPGTGPSRWFPCQSCELTAEAPLHRAGGGRMSEQGAVHASPAQPPVAQPCRRGRPRATLPRSWCSVGVPSWVCARDLCWEMRPPPVRGGSARAGTASKQTARGLRRVSPAVPCPKRGDLSTRELCLRHQTCCGAGLSSTSECSAWGRGAVGAPGPGWRRR